MFGSSFACCLQCSLSTAAFRLAACAAALALAATGCTELQTSFIVGPEGANFDLPGGASLEIPQGALAEETTIEVSLIAGGGAADLVESGWRVSPGYVEDVQFGVGLEPTGLRFAAPATLRLPWTGPEDDDGVALFRADHQYGRWSPVGEVEQADGFVTASIDGFSGYTVARLKANACPFMTPAQWRRFLEWGRTEYAKIRHSPTMGTVYEGQSLAMRTTGPFMRNLGRFPGPPVGEPGWAGFGVEYYSSQISIRADDRYRMCSRPGLFLEFDEGFFRPAPENPRTYWVSYHSSDALNTNCRALLADALPDFVEHFGSRRSDTWDPDDQASIDRLEGCRALLATTDPAQIMVTTDFVVFNLPPDGAVEIALWDEETSGYANVSEINHANARETGTWDSNAWVKSEGPPLVPGAPYRLAITRQPEEGMLCQFASPGEGTAPEDSGDVLTMAVICSRCE